MREEHRKITAAKTREIVEGTNEVFKDIYSQMEIKKRKRRKRKNNRTGLARLFGSR